MKVEIQVEGNNEYTIIVRSNYHFPEIVLSTFVCIISFSFHQLNGLSSTIIIILQRRKPRDIEV